MKIHYLTLTLESNKVFSCKCCLLYHCLTLGPIRIVRVCNGVSNVLKPLRYDCMNYNTGELTSLQETDKTVH